MGILEKLLRGAAGLQSGHHRDRWGGGRHGYGYPQVPPLPQASPPAGAACGKCGTPSILGSRFCAQCGTSLAPAQCTECSSVVAPGARFCASCGKPQS